MAVDSIYFSLTVRDSPYSKDLQNFCKKLNEIEPDNALQMCEVSRVLPYHGTAGHTGIVFCVLDDTLTNEQKYYLEQFAFVYEDRGAFEIAKSASYQKYYDVTPDPG